MKKLLICSAVAAMCLTVACVSRSSAGTETRHSAEVRVSVFEMPCEDGYIKVAVSDTASLAAGRPDGTRIAFIPGSESDSCMAVLYSVPEVMAETVTVSEVSDLEDGADDVIASFHFSDCSRWAGVTVSNIGRRIAVAVNGQVVSAPMVMSEIKEGGCSVVLGRGRAGELGLLENQDGA